MKTYVEPTIKVFEFDKEEILTVSGGNGLNVGGQGGSEGELEWGQQSIHN